VDYEAFGSGPQATGCVSSAVPYSLAGCRSLLAGWKATSDFGDSCDTACAEHGHSCTDGTWPALGSSAAMEVALEEADYDASTCTSWHEGNWDNLNPSMESDGECYYGRQDHDCSYTSSSYKRLCWCE
jgi:hypothetical protein